MIINYGHRGQTAWLAAMKCFFCLFLFSYNPPKEEDQLATAATWTWWKQHLLSENVGTDKHPLKRLSVFFISTDAYIQKSDNFAISRSLKHLVKNRFITLFMLIFNFWAILGVMENMRHKWRDGPLKDNRMLYSIFDVNNMPFMLM